MNASPNHPTSADAKSVEILLARALGGVNFAVEVLAGLCAASADAKVTHALIRTRFDDSDALCPPIEAVLAARGRGDAKEIAQVLSSSLRNMRIELTVLADSAGRRSIAVETACADLGRAYETAVSQLKLIDQLLEINSPSVRKYQGRHRYYRRVIGELIGAFA